MSSSTMFKPTPDFTPPDMAEYTNQKDGTLSRCIPPNAKIRKCFQNANGTSLHAPVPRNRRFIDLT